MPSGGAAQADADGLWRYSPESTIGGAVTYEVVIMPVVMEITGPNQHAAVLDHPELDLSLRPGELPIVWVKGRTEPPFTVPIRVTEIVRDPDRWAYLIGLCVCGLAKRVEVTL